MEKSRILIVDDDRNFRKTLVDILGAKGYTARAVGSGSEALDIIDTVSPSVALIDLKLDDMSGLELLPCIKEKKHDMECIVLTGHASQKSAIDAVNLGAYSYVQKPYDIEQLILTIRRAVEKIESDRAFHESEERFRTIFETAKDSIFMKDTELRYTAANPAMGCLFDCNPDDLIGRTDSDLFGREADEHIQDVDGRVLSGMVVEEEHTKPVGDDIRTFHVIKVPLKNDLGEVAGLCGIARDVTARKRAELALKESEERYRHISELTSDYAYSFVIDENGSARPEWITEAFLRDTGYAKQDLDGNTWYREVVKEEDISVLLKHMKEIYAGDRSVGEFRIVNRDGSVRWIRNHAFPVMDPQSGNLIRTLGAAKDITNEKIAQEELEKERRSLARKVDEQTAELLEANAELARAARMKDEFLANMSHELRTPLNTILGMTEALQDEVFGDLNEKQANSLKRVEESGRHLLSLINDILDVAKIESGKIDLNLGTVGVDSLCQSSLGMIRQIAHKKRLKVSQKISGDVEVFDGDERRLKQVLVNLLSNAVKFTPENGTIGLEVEGDSSRQDIRFTIWDTGIGISNEQMHTLFKPFVQVDSQLSREYEGTGLGLTLVHRLTALHCGGLIAESEEGKGTRITVRLPVGHKPAAEPAFRKIGTGKTILVVDDHEVNRELYAEYLEYAGFRVQTAKNGSECLDAIADVTPDIVLLDMIMPDMDGSEVVKRLRKRSDDSSRIPIIIISSLRLPDDDKISEEAGASAYLTRPVSFEKLIGILSDTID